MFQRCEVGGTELGHCQEPVRRGQNHLTTKCPTPLPANPSLQCQRTFPSVRDRELESDADGKESSRRRGLFIYKARNSSC